MNMLLTSEPEEVGGHPGSSSVHLWPLGTGPGLHGPSHRVLSVSAGFSPPHVGLFIVLVAISLLGVLVN